MRKMGWEGGDSVGLGDEADIDRNQPLMALLGLLDQASPEAITPADISIL